MVDGGNNISCLIFWKHSAFNEFRGATDISFQMRGQSFPPSTVWEEAEVVTHGNLYVNKHATCDFKISYPVTVSLL